VNALGSGHTHIMDKSNFKKPVMCWPKGQHDWSNKAQYTSCLYNFKVGKKLPNSKQHLPPSILHPRAAITPYQQKFLVWQAVALK